MDRWVGKVAVVTGASSGIGRYIAEALFKEGMIVVGLARRKAKMEDAMKQLKGKGKFYARACDISNDQDVIEAFLWIKNNIGMVQVLVNNAGIARPTRTLIDVDIDTIRDVIGINVMGALFCTHEAIKIMKDANVEGHIVNISSVIGHPGNIPVTFNVNAYGPSKFAMTALSEVIEMEMRGGKIRATNISPGYVKTELLEVADVSKEFLSDVPVLQSNDVAEAVIYALGRPLRVHITEITLKPLGELL